MGISLWISVPLGSLTAIVISAHYYYKNAFNFWKDRGLAGPRAYPLIGNFGGLILDREAPGRWMRQFGKVYGVYEGSEPILVVSDAAVVQQLCVKDFNKFPNHNGKEFNSKLSKSFILNARDDHWRRVRAVLSPTFTSGKMRRMFKLIDICADNMVEAMHERLKERPVVNLKDLFGLYTMDAIASCCYGLRLMGYKGEASLTTASKGDEFVRLGMKLFDFSVWRIILLVCIHPKLLEKFEIGFISGSAERAFASKVEQIIKGRGQSNKHFDDYLQTLIDSKLDTEDYVKPDENHPDSEKHHSGGQFEHQKLDSEKLRKTDGSTKLLSEIEILSSATFLLVVGLETTSTLLTNCFYALGFHQEIQEKLYQTIKSLAKMDNQNRPTFDYDSLTSCHYLDAVISESLRTQPPLAQTDRVALEDYYLESYDLHIPKGMRVALTLNTIMMDPDNWPEPDVFNPDRFMPENQHKIKPNSYCPFGTGPRHCLGMRFSLTESKLGLAKMLMEFKFEPAPGTTYPPEMKLNLGLGNMKRPEVMVAKR